MKRVSWAFWQDNLSRRGFVTAIFLGICGLSFLGLFWFRLSPQVPLFYSHPWGEEQLASPIFLFLLPGGVFLILLTNLLVASFFSEEKLILRVMALASVVFAFLGLFSLMKIIFLMI